MTVTMRMKVIILLDGEGVAGVNGVMAPSSGATLTAGYPTTHLATHPLPEHTSSIAPQFAGNLRISSTFTYTYCRFERNTYQSVNLSVFDFFVLDSTVFTVNKDSVHYLPIVQLFYLVSLSHMYIICAFINIIIISSFIIEVAL